MPPPRATAAAAVPSVAADAVPAVAARAGDDVVMAEAAEDPPPLLALVPRKRERESSPQHLSLHHQPAAPAAASTPSVAAAPPAAAAAAPTAPVVTAPAPAAVAAAPAAAAGTAIASSPRGQQPCSVRTLGPPLGSLGLPEPIVQYYLKAKKISRLYPWQAECLALEGVSDHRANLVYCAPTSGGKSLVAEVLLVKRLIAGLGAPDADWRGAGKGRGGGGGGSGGALALMILPFVTLCHERAEELTKMLKPLNIEVRRFFGGQGGKLPPVGGPGGLIIATPEKANDLMTRLIEEERVRELAVVVVDELHMVQDPHRGATLELMLTKLLFAAGKAAHLAGGDRGGGGGGSRSPSAAVTSPPAAALSAGGVPVHDHLIPLSAGSGGAGLSQLAALPLQIVGMSATLPNVDGLARWLNDAALYETDYRPVELSVFVKKGREIHAVKAASDGGASLTTFERELTEGADADHVVELAKETMEKQDGGVIIFCATKKQCETVAANLARKLPASIATKGGGAMDVGEEAPRGFAAASKKAPPLTPPALLSELVEQLRRVTTGSDDGNRSLAACVSRGVAWHNAGLHAEEKAVVELAFRSGLVRIMCCTSTMAAGVNMPASRVILISPYIFKPNPALHELLPSRELLQMVGRAGRAGLSEKGEAFVVCPKPAAIKWDFLDSGTGAGGSGSGGTSAGAASLAVAPVVKKDLDAVAMELTKRLTSREDALSSTIAAAGMRRVMMEAVACGLAQTPADIKRYIQCTLLNALNDFQDVVAKGATEALKWLSAPSRGFLAWDAASFQWQPQPLGLAAASAHLDPFGATAVIEDVRKARRCLILETDLHLLFLCVPPDLPAAMDVEAAENKQPAVAKREGGDALAAPAATSATASATAAATASAAATTGAAAAAAATAKAVPYQGVNTAAAAAKVDSACWLKPHIFTRVYQKLSEHEQAVAHAVGVTESYVSRLERSISDKTPEHRRLRRVCHRFLQALMLHDVISEVDEDKIKKGFGLVGSNVLAHLQDVAARYASQVASVCGPMGWGDMEVLVTRLHDRITAGAQEEILCLTSIPMIGAARARALYNAGYRTPEAIARISSAPKLAKVLESCRGSKGGELRSAQIILRGAKVLCEEQRRAAREESEAKLRELERLPSIDESIDGDGDDDDDAEAAEAAAEAEVAALDIRSARGTVVVRDPAALDVLAAHWRGAETYAFCLQPGNDNNGNILAGALGHGPAASPPAGIALAFAYNPRATFYAPIVVTATASKEEQEEEERDTSNGGRGGGGDGRRQRAGGTRGFPWEIVRDILATKGARKVTVDLKPQLRAMGAADAALAAAHAAASSASTSSSFAASRPGFGVGTVAAPAVDVRVAGWLLHPDADALSCGVGSGWFKISEGVGETNGPAESLLRFFGAEVDVPAVRASSRWPNGLAKSSRHHAAAANTAAAAAAALAVDAALRLHLGDKDPALERALVELEMPLVPVLAAMEAVGVGFAPEALRRQLRQANRRLREVEVECAGIIGRAGAAPASLTSSNDVERVLFQDLKLPVPPYAVIERGGGGGGKNFKKRFRTNAETLQALCSQHPLPALILEHRTLSKCASMAEDMVELIDKQQQQQVVGQPQQPNRAAVSSAVALALSGKGLADAAATAAGAAIATTAAAAAATTTAVAVVRLRGLIHQTNTETGRLAMEEPNLQNVPKPRSYALSERYIQRMSAGGVVGAVQAESSLTHSVKGAWSGFNPRTYEVKTRFQNLLSNATCAATARESAPGRRPAPVKSSPSAKPSEPRPVKC
jgi:DNA polymerase theta